MILNISESGHPVLRGSSALERGDLKSKGNEQLSLHFCGDDKTVEMILRTIISVDQLSIYGAVADMCDELACRISGCSERTGKLVAQDNPSTTVIPTELTTTNKSPRTDDNVPGNLLHNSEQQFANLPDHLQLIKLCSNVGITAVARDSISRPSTMRNWTKLGGSCRGYTLPRDNAASKVTGLIRGNTKIGPALEVGVSHHQGRYGIEIMIESSFGDGTRSWVMIVNGINKYVTEMSEETQENHLDDNGDCTGKLVAGAKPKQTSIPTTSSSTATLPLHMRDWIAVEPGPHDKGCFEVSRKMIRLLRHDPSVLRSRIQSLGTDVSFRIYVFSALVNSSIAEVLAKRRRS